MKYDEKEKRKRKKKDKDREKDTDRFKAQKKREKIFTCIGVFIIAGICVYVFICISGAKQDRKFKEYRKVRSSIIDGIESQIEKGNCNDKSDELMEYLYKMTDYEINSIDEEIEEKYKNEAKDIHKFIKDELDKDYKDN